MENTISGESGNMAVKPVTAANFRPSPKTGKKNTRKTKEPITPAEAAELLTSALKYCQEAGLIVSGYNEGQTLVLFIDRLEYSNDRIRVVTLIPNVNVTPVTVDK
jgi:hypothetical protein